MYSSNPYSRQAIKNPYPQQQYYQQPYYDDYYYEQPQQPVYYPQPREQIQQYQEPYYEQPPHQLFPDYSSYIQPSYSTQNLKKSFSSYGCDGMITDIEYLDFPFDSTYKKQPLYQRSHNKIANVVQKSKDPVQFFFLALLEQLGVEKQLEDLRKQLTLQLDFNVVSFFQFFDKNNTQNITLEELFQGFQQLGMLVDYQALFLVYYRFSEYNRQDTMSLANFVQMFQPIGSNPRVQKQQNIMPGKITLKILSELMKLYQQNEIRFEETRVQLINYDIDIQKVFQMMDTNQTRNIGLTEFMNALNYYSAKKVVPSESTLLFMRFDRSRNGLISFMEFKKEMEIKLQQ